MPLARFTSHAGELPVDLLQRGRDPVLADRVGRRLELPGHVGAGELQALGRAVLLGVFHLGPAAAAIVLAGIHLLLQPGLGVDESLTSVTHTAVFSVRAMGTPDRTRRARSGDATPVPGRVTRKCSGKPARGASGTAS